MRLLTYIFSVLFLATCGGGGGGSEDPTDTGSSSIISQVHQIEAYDETSFDIIASSTDGSAITYSIASQPSYGQAALSGNTITYTPQANYAGSDVIQISASSNSGSITIGIQLDVFNNPYKDYRLTNVQKKTTDYPFGNGTYADYTCIWDGVERQFSVYVPNVINPYQSNYLPVYFYFHGTHGQSLPSNYQDRLQRIQKYAGSNFIYVRPQGLPGTEEEGNENEIMNLRGFNYLYPGWRENNDDIGFTNALINYLHDTHPISHRKIYIGGYSTGGSFVPVMGSENELIDGVVQGAGMMHTYYTYTYDQPIKYKVWKGTNDDYHPYGYDENYPTFWGINEGLAMFAQNKSCSDATYTDLTDVNGDGHISERFQIECVDGSVFQGYKLTEWGHTEAWGIDYIVTQAFSDVSIFEMAGELINSN